MADETKAAERWTVRAVPAEVQERASQAARQAGMKLGPWLTSVILAHLDQPGSHSTADRQTTPIDAADIGDVQSRLATLERDVSRLFAMLPDSQKSAAPKAIGSRPAAVGSQKTDNGSHLADIASDNRQTEGSQAADKPHKPGPTTRMLSAETAEKVLDLVRQGLGTRTIAARLEVTRDQVTGVIRRAERSGELSRTEGQ